MILLKITMYMIAALIISCISVMISHVILKVAADIMTVIELWKRRQKK